MEKNFEVTTKKIKETILKLEKALQSYTFAFSNFSNFYKKWQK